MTPMRMIGMGLVLIALGLGITYVSYEASSDGSYSVFWGLAVVGAYFVLKGLWTAASQKNPPAGQ